MTSLAFPLNHSLEVTREEKARAGDLDAFNALVLENQQVVFRVCYRILRDVQAAEDVTQDSFVSAWLNIGKVQPGRFRPWLLTIASNACKTRLRRLKRRPEASLDLAAEVASPAATPEQHAVQKDLRREIDASLEQLPYEQREALVLYHDGELNYQEIAAVTKSSVGTVKSRLNRGRNRMRTLMGSMA